MLNFLKRIKLFLETIQSGRKVYLFCWFSLGLVGYLWKYHNDRFGFTEKELLYIALVLIYLFLNRMATAKIHGHRFGKYL